jgi:putative FmdB family regulatory protein
VPIYDYVCTACGTRIEVMHGVHDSGPVVCSTCGGTLRRALSPPAIVFKGSGWAKKDARTASRQTGTTGDGEGKADGAKSEPAKPAADGGDQGAARTKAEAKGGSSDTSAG